MDKEELIDKTATALSNMKLSKETVKDILTNFAREINSSGLNEAKVVSQNEQTNEVCDHTDLWFNKGDEYAECMDCGFKDYNV